MIAAFFMLVLTETGRIPVENHGGTLEFGQIEEGRVAEHSGPGSGVPALGIERQAAAAVHDLRERAGGAVGDGGRRAARASVLAIGLLFARRSAVGAAVVVIESSFAKLRLYKIPEFTVASFMLAVLAVVIFLFQPAFGDLHLSVFGAAATITAVAGAAARADDARARRTCGSSCACTRSGRWWSRRSRSRPRRPGTAAARCTCSAAATIALKALLFPLGIRFVLRRLDAEPRVPSMIGVAERDPDRDRAVRVRVHRAAPDPHRRRGARCRCRRCRSRSAGCWSRSC